MFFDACIQVLNGPTYIPAITLPALKGYINIYTTGRFRKYGSSCLFSLLQPTSSEESAEETSGDYSESFESEADSEVMAVACTSTIRRASKSPRSKPMHLKRELGYSPAATDGSSNGGREK